jgi:hypothetical protein
VKHLGAWQWEGRRAALTRRRAAWQRLPELVEQRRRAERALRAVGQQAYACGVSTRRVDQLAEPRGLWISKSEVSRVCAAVDAHVGAFPTRSLAGASRRRRANLSIDVGEVETGAF